MALPRRTFLLAAAVAVVAACGPSSAQIKTAREARYQGTRDEVFLAVSEAVAREAKIDKVDAAAGALLTVGRWYEKDGTYEDKAVSRDDLVRLEDGSLWVAFVVKVVGDAPPFQVVVEPTVDQIRSGYSALYHMKPDDPQLPGWVQGKVDDLQLAVYARLKGRVVVAPGTTPPAP